MMARAVKVGSRVRLKHRIGHLENAKGTVKEVYGDWLTVVVDGYSWHNEHDLERLSSDAVTVLKPDTPPPTSRDVMKFIMKKWPGLSYERIRFLDDVHPDPKDRARLLSDEALEEFDRCRWFFDVGPRAPLYTEPEFQMNNVYLQALMRESETRDVNTPALGVIVAAAIHEGLLPIAPGPDGCIFWIPKSYWSALNKKPLERFRGLTVTDLVERRRMRRCLHNEVS